MKRRFGQDTNKADEPELFSAVRRQDRQAVLDLLADGADVNAVNVYGENCVHIAIGGRSEDNLMILEDLVEHGADINHKDNNQESPLLYAAVGSVGDPAFMERLLKLGARTGADKSGRSPIHSAALIGRCQVLQLLVNKDGPDVRTTTDNATPLHIAAGEAHTECVRLLISRGTDVNAVCVSGETPLHRLAEHVEYSRDDGSTIDTMKLLLDSGAMIDVKNNDGYTPLHIILKITCHKLGDIRVFHYLRKSAPLLEHLLMKGAHLDSMSNAGESAYTDLKRIVEAVGQEYPQLTSLMSQWRPLSLKCLAAQVIGKYKHCEGFTSAIPPGLVSFVDLY